MNYINLTNGHLYVTIYLIMELTIIVKEYVTLEGFSQIAQWRKDHPDFRSKIDAAIVRLEAGNISSVKWLPSRAGIGEYRINWGPGL